MRTPPDDPIAHRLASAAAEARLFGGEPAVVDVGRYHVRRWLGAGASGSVYAAWDPKLRREIALKVLRAAPRGERVLDEARALARLAHPSVVTVHDVGEHDGHVFVTMAMVEGTSLRDWRRGRSRADVVEAWFEVGRALAAAHAEGIVHRDVKPDNVVVGVDGAVTLVDFGLAEVQGAKAGVAGTPAYMAPEQRRGEAAQAKTDQYAFAVSMQELLEGQLPRRMERALARARADRPDDRFGDMDALLAALSDDPVGRSLRWTMTTGLVVFALVALVGAVLQMIVFARVMWGA